jgi:putative Holliday junction resolvase
MATVAQSFLSALGLDIGRKRVGVAGCDGTGLIATGLTTIYRQSFRQLVDELRRIAADRHVQVLVVGLPYTMSGELGYQAKQVQKTAQGLASALKLPLAYVDERLTSVQAEEMMRSCGLSPAQHKEVIDRKAAAIILQQWLDERRSQQSSLLLSSEDCDRSGEFQTAPTDLPHVY